MKEENTDIQMQIFDLLEGNLNAEEAANLQARIAADKNLKREYDLMSMAYLTEKEAIVFPNKQRLYRKGWFTVRSMPVLRYAAAIALLATFTYIVYRNWDGGVHETVAETRALKATPEQRKEWVGKNSETVSASESAAVQSQNPRTDRKPTLLPTGDTNATLPFMLPVAAKKQDIPDPMPVIIAEVKPEPNLPLLPPNDDTAHVWNAPVGPVPVSKKRSLGYKLLNDSRVMLASLKLPHVNFSAERQKDRVIPTVKMTISTLNTDIIATLIE